LALWEFAGYEFNYKTTGCSPSFAFFCLNKLKVNLKNGLIVKADRKAFVTLDRVKDGLYIRGKTLTMFVSEDELADLR
jgi:hypothetical protein